jgi:hypothetical protein
MKGLSCISNIKFIEMLNLKKNSLIFFHHVSKFSLRYLAKFCRFARLCLKGITCFEGNFFISIDFHQVVNYMYKGIIDISFKIFNFRNLIQIDSMLYNF